jgi:dipeptidyl aminopeptidase/acylaminoacyl peptidase
MSSRIINRNIIELSEQRNKMIISGWGKETLDNSVVESITYLSDGLKIKGYLAYPQNNENNIKYPCIIWNRGGVGENGVIDEFTARGMFGQMAAWGYTVFASMYRGAAGSEGREDFGGEDVNDILNLIPLADELTCADKNIWGMEGWSRGGMMTLLALTRSDNFKCAVLSGAISNLKQYVDSGSKTGAMLREALGADEFNQLLESRSVINFVEKLPRKTKMLIIHGSADETVSPFQSIELSKKLLSLKMHHRLVILEEGNHFLTRHRREVDAMRKAWYKKYLV